MLGKEAKRAATCPSISSSLRFGRNGWAGKGVTYTYHFLVSADVTPTFDKGPILFINPYIPYTKDVTLLIIYY